ncbi:MAG TPA: type VI immunity family protein [Polyangiales bacterium]|nr:type VI immunity family protein [Polyangiales bacterium]
MAVLHDRIRALVKEILSLEHEAARREGTEMDSRAGTPAPATRIQAAQAAREFEFSPEYRAFLELHDGWQSFSWSMSLRSSAELASAEYTRGWLDDGDEAPPPALERALAIGASDSDAALLLLLPNGEVVDWLYQEEQRFPNFIALLQDRREVLERMQASATAARARVQREWTQAYRDQADAELLPELRELLAGAVDPQPSAAGEPAPEQPLPAEVAPEALVLRDGETLRAEVELQLVLYLSAAPSPAEVRATWAAFRRHFPVQGTLQWTQAHHYQFGLQTAESADDLALVERLDIDAEGYFGLRALLTAADGGGRYTLNLRGLPPIDADGDAPLPQASFCELLLPSNASAQALAALARELLEFLPVRSGHAGYAASGDESAVSCAQIFAWCRRFLALDVGRVDGFLPGAWSRLRGASWLTLLGRPFASALEEARRFPSGAQVERCKRGVLIRAGAAPTLGDVARGEFPAQIAGVAQALEPLLLDSYDERGMFATGGRFLHVLRDELPSFAPHGFTHAFLRRLVDPATFLGQTPRERAEALLRRLAPGKGRVAFTHWQQALQKGQASPKLLARLLAVAAAAHGCESVDAARALEWTIDYSHITADEILLDQSYNNLLIAYQFTGELERARRLLPYALERAERNPFIYHSAACVLVKLGELEQGLTCVRWAKQHGYPHMDRLREDRDLSPIASDPRFEAIFS